MYFSVELPQFFEMDRELFLKVVERTINHNYANQIPSKHKKKIKDLKRLFDQLLFSWEFMVTLS